MENQKDPFKKEKIILIGAVTILGLLIVLGGNSLTSTSNFLYSSAVNGLKLVATKALTGEAQPGQAIFTDIPANDPNATALKYLKDNQIMTGYPDGSFAPDKSVNRAEMLKIVIAALGAPSDLSGYKDCFNDVHEEWFAPYVCYAKSKNWVSGYADGGFHPANNVSRVESLKMIIGAFGLPLEIAAPANSAFADLSVNMWFTKYVWTAEKDAVMTAWKNNTTANLSNDASRLDVATAIYQLKIGGSVETI